MEKTSKSGGAKKGDNFKVIVRVRPCLPHEERANAKQCVSVDEGHGIVTIKKPEPRSRSSMSNHLIGIDDFGELIKSDPTVKHDFNFDIIFNPSTAQEIVYESCVEDIVVSVLEGYNGSIIAYGQTGTGKSYTIEGGMEQQRGIVPRAAEAIFHYIQTNADSNTKFLVRASFLEIYNERISDLMNPARDNLRIRDGGVGEAYVEGLSEHILKTPKDVKALLKKGSHVRATAETKMNKESSRSHAVFTIIVEHSVTDEDGSGSTVTVGKLRLVDLAGSEKIDTEARGRTQEETKNINVSLHFFGKVVMALTSPGIKHIPYRDSKLTRILQDSLGGNCKTAMITTISPMSTCYSETFRSLNFAKRAKLVKNNAVINKDLSQKAMLSAYEAEIKQLKQQLNQREGLVDLEQLERLKQERQKAEQEKDEVLSELQMQQAKAQAAQAEKEEYMKKITVLENMLITGGKDVKESDEFHQAIELEKEKIRLETEIQFQRKFAELEKEKIRLERQKVELEKEMIAKMRSEPDGKRDDVDYENGHAGKSLTVAGAISKSLSSSTVKKPLNGPNFSRSISASTNVLKVPHSRVQATSNQSLSSDPGIPRPVLNAFTASSRPNSGPTPGANQRLSRQADHEPPEGPVEAFVSPSPASVSSVSPAKPQQLDEASVAALQEYAQALAHPVSGIPCQEMHSGVRIFTGSGAVQWFLTNMESITTLQLAQDVGQRLMDLNVFVGIQGSRKFTVSDSVYYQFTEIASNSNIPVASQPQRYSSRMLNSTSRPSSVMSIQSVDQYGSYMSEQGDPLLASQISYKAPVAHNATRRSSWGSIAGSSLSLMDQSTVNLSPYPNSADIVEQFGLHHLNPSPLHYSAIQGDRSRLKMLAREMNEVDVKDNAGNTPLMYAVMGRQSKCCLQLLRLAARVNTTNHEGQTALMIATHNNLDEMIKILLKNGALTHYINHDGETVYHIAARSENFKCLEYLCKYSSDLQYINERDHHYQTALHNAVTANLPGNAKRLLMAKADLGVSDDQGCTALHYAVRRQSLPCIQAIVETNKNDVNLVDTNGQSALHFACLENSLECLNYLLSTKECDINLKDKTSSTPLHLATKSNRPNVVKILVQHGANTTIRDTNGKTPLHYAMQMGHTDCAHAIQSHGT